jgi:hypothetical protein
MAVFPTTPTTSGTYNFNPSVGNLIISAFSRIQVRRTEITQTHLQDAVVELNLLQQEVNNTGPNLWTVDLQSIPLVQGIAVYSVPSDTIQVLDIYITYGSPSTDRLMFALSRTEYASLSNKQSQGFPSQYWFDRLISPTLTFYLVPDGNGPYTANYYRFRQIQDSMIGGGNQMDSPQRFLDAFVAGLAYRLCRIYPPNLPGVTPIEFEALRKKDWDDAWMKAAKQDTEDVPQYIIPGISSYFR